MCRLYLATLTKLQQQYMPVGGIVDVEVRDVTNINTIFVTPCKLLECGYLDVLNEVMASCYEHHHVQAPLVDRYAVNSKFSFLSFLETTVDVLYKN